MGDQKLEQEAKGLEPEVQGEEREASAARALHAHQNGCREHAKRDCDGVDGVQRGLQEIHPVSLVEAKMAAKAIRRDVEPDSAQHC